MLSAEERRKIIQSIIEEPVHGGEYYKPEDQPGIDYRDSYMYKMMEAKVELILSQLGLEHEKDKKVIIDKVNQYIMDNVKIRDAYFDVFTEKVDEFSEHELKFRTAYGALVRGQAMCAGITEASRILLECCGLKTKTVLSKLPGRNKQLLHYVTIVEYDNGSGRKYYVMDPDREKSCAKKGYDFKRYLMEMTYILPEEYFFENKVGYNGVGPRASDYMEQHKPKMAVGKNEVGKLFEDQKELS